MRKLYWWLVKKFAPTRFYVETQASKSSFAHMDSAPTIPRRTPPRCEYCGLIVGACEHTGGPTDWDAVDAAQRGLR